MKRVFAARSVAVVLPGFADPAHPDRSTHLHVETLGHGPLRVTFLPGLGGTTRQWISTEVQPPFQHARTELVDLYGFGHPPRPWLPLHGRASCRGTRANARAGVAARARRPFARCRARHDLFAAHYSDRVQALCLLGLPDYGSLAGAVEWFARQRGGWIYRLPGHASSGRPLAAASGARPRAAQHGLVHDVDVGRALPARPASCRGGGATAGPALTCVHGTRDATAPPARVVDLASRFPRWRHVALDADHHPWRRVPAICHAEIAVLCPAVHHRHGHAEALAQ